ncbi:MAG TPA: tail fiber domain-containing protein [Candidatus Hodarchaeales archaeon]|nr:tail fiber domain-containing protein [Candidatus Hodarchaeales archaeon]
MAQPGPMPLKNLNENFFDVNGKKLLKKIEDISIRQWNYKNEDESVTHIGPTAQDFKKTFGVGGNDKSISTVDPSGIALAAIKELNKKNQELTKQNGELKKELENLKKKVDELVSSR